VLPERGGDDPEGFEGEVWGEGVEMGLQA